MKRKKKAIRILLIVAIAQYSVLFMELFIRLFCPVAIMPRYVHATEFGIRGNEPNKKYWQKTPETKVFFSINSKGIRSNCEIPYEKAGNIQRIVVLGDSFGMGYEVSLEDSFTSQLSRFLEAKGVQVEVVNLSVSGHGNAEQYIMLVNEGFKYHPDLVLLQWHSTDIQDNIRSNLYALENGRLVPRSNTYLPGVEISRTLFQIPGYRLMAENSQLYSYFREKVAMEIKDILVSLRSRSKTPIESTLHESEMANEYKEDLTIALIDKMRQECQERNSAFLVLDIPRIRGRTEFWSVFPRHRAEPLIFEYYCPIEDFYKADGAKLYWEKGHGHLTPLGCKIIGRGLTDYIINNNLL